MGVLRIEIYYINTNKISGELLRENLTSSHVKITCYLHMWKYHRCYGFIINHSFRTKKLLKWNGLVVHWCLYNKIRNFSSRVKKIFHSFQHSRNFVSPRSHVISSMYHSFISIIFIFFFTFCLFFFWSSNTGWAEAPWRGSGFLLFWWPQFRYDHKHTVQVCS